MKKYLLLFVLAVATYNVFAQSSLKEFMEHTRETRADSDRQHYIDPYLEERKAKREELYSECREEDLSFRDSMDCIEGATKKANEEYPDRGSKEYAQMTYGALSRPEAEKVRDELIKLMDSIHFMPQVETEEVELTSRDVQREITFIEQHILKIAPRDYR